MKHLIIIGAGGMGRTMYDMARESIGYGTQYDIRGFIDDNTSALNNFANYPPVGDLNISTSQRFTSYIVRSPFLSLITDTFSRMPKIVRSRARLIA